MSTIFEQLDDFRRFADEQLSGDDADLTITQLFDRWQLMTPTEKELQEGVAAFERGVADVRAGQTITAEESIGRLRRRLKQS